MKKFLIVILIVLSAFVRGNSARDFHIEVAGIESVTEFESKFPEIVSNEAVYIAYLQQYYNGYEDEYIKLIKL